MVRVTFTLELDCNEVLDVGDQGISENPQEVAEYISTKYAEQIDECMGAVLGTTQVLNLDWEPVPEIGEEERVRY